MGMKLKLLIVGLLLSFSVQATDYTATLVEVKDGDTIKLSVNLWPGLYQTILVRVNGVDTPEKGWRAKCVQENERSKLATAHTKGFLNGPIILSNVKLGKYAGRVLGDISVNGKDLAKSLISSGHAREYKGGKREGWCEESR